MNISLSHISVSSATAVHLVQVMDPEGQKFLHSSSYIRVLSFFTSMIQKPTIYILPQFVQFLTVGLYGYIILWVLTIKLRFF